MTRKLGLYFVAAATALMVFATADEAQAWGRRGGGSCGSDGGYSSHGGSGSFGGRFRRSRGSWGSNGGYGSDGGHNNGCGSHGGYNNGCDTGCDNGGDAGCTTCGEGEVVYGEVHEHEAQYHERADATFDSNEARETGKPMPAPAEVNRDAERATENQSNTDQAEQQPDQQQGEVEQQSQANEQEAPRDQNQSLPQEANESGQPGT